MRRERPVSKRTVDRSWSRRKILYASLGLGLALTLSPSIAFAYFDPNAGGMLFQLLSPVIFIAAAMMLAIRGGIRSVISGIRSTFRRGGRDPAATRRQK